MLFKDPVTPRGCQYTNLRNDSVLKSATDNEDDFCNNIF